MHAALLSNSTPCSNDGRFRFNALAPNLAREAPPAAAHLTLFASGPAPFVPAPPAPFRDVHPLPAPAELPEFLSRHRFDLLLLDYDATAGTHRERASFLRLAAVLLKKSPGVPFAVLASESNAFPDGGHLSVAAARNRNAFDRLLKRTRALVTFSSATAARLREKLDREVQVVPAGSPIPSPTVSRTEARAQLGFPEPRRDILIGLLGRHGEMNLDWFTAGCTEAHRVASSVRLLYIGEDGALIRNHRFPIPFHDAGSPSPEEVSVRLRAMDFAILPSSARADARPDRLALTACLQHGLPVIASAPESGIDPLFKAPPDGFTLVPVNELGGFLVAVETTCHRIARQTLADRSSDDSIAAYYQSHLSAQTALEQLFALVSGS